MNILILKNKDEYKRQSLDKITQQHLVAFGVNHNDEKYFIVRKNRLMDKIGYLSEADLGKLIQVYGDLLVE